MLMMNGKSGACIDHVLEKYDVEKKLLPRDEGMKWRARSWRDFQVSDKPLHPSLSSTQTSDNDIPGQGPYFGQYSWFLNYHPFDLPSVKDRYQNEILRIVGVMDKQLSKTPYLAGETVTYVDLMWLPYFIVAWRVPGVDFKERFPGWGRWWE